MTAAIEQEHHRGAAFDVAVGQTLRLVIDGAPEITITVEAKGGQRSRLRVAAPRDAVRLVLSPQKQPITPR